MTTFDEKTKEYIGNPFMFQSSQCSLLQEKTTVERPKKEHVRNQHSSHAELQAFMSREQYDTTERITNRKEVKALVEKLDMELVNDFPVDDMPF